LAKAYGHHGPVFRVFIGPSVCDIVNDFETLSHLYGKTKSFQREGAVFRGMKVIAPGALFNTEGMEWRRHRTAMNPFFAEEEVDKFCSDILTIAQEEYDDIEPGKPFLLEKWTSALTSRILMKTLFDVSVNKKIATELKRLNDSIPVFDDWVGMVLMAYMICPSFIEKTQILKKFIERKTSTFKGIIKEMKENPTPDCLWQQLTVNGKFTWEEFESESFGLMFAGYETTSYSLCYLLLCLSKYPEAKLKLKQEINNVLGGKLPTAQDIKNLPYLDKFILESLRLQPIVLVANRTAVAQDSIGEYQIPKDTIIFGCPWNIIPKSGEDPEKFDPDRYNEENYKQLSKIPMAIFAVGPHQCVGKNLAMLEMKLITVLLLQNEDLEVNTTMKDEFNSHAPTRVPKKLTAIKKSKFEHLENSDSIQQKKIL